MLALLILSLNGRESVLSNASSSSLCNFFCYLMKVLVFLKKKKKKKGIDTDKTNYSNDIIIVMPSLFLWIQKTSWFFIIFILLFFIIAKLNWQRCSCWNWMINLFNSNFLLRMYGLTYFIQFILLNKSIRNKYASLLG